MFCVVWFYIDEMTVVLVCGWSVRRFGMNLVVISETFGRVVDCVVGRIRGLILML